MFTTRSRLAAIAAAELSMTRALKAQDTQDLAAKITDAAREHTSQLMLHGNVETSITTDTATGDVSITHDRVPAGRVYAVPALHASSKTRRKGENRAQHRARMLAAREA